MSNDTRHAMKVLAHWLAALVVIPLYLFVGAVHGVAVGMKNWWEDAQDAEPINWRGT